MRYLFCLLLVSCTAEPLPVPQGPAPYTCPAFIRCTFGGYCADMIAFCGCFEYRQEGDDCVYCELESGKTFIPQHGGGCFYALPSKP